MKLAIVATTTCNITFMATQLLQRSAAVKEINLSISNIHKAEASTSATRILVEELKSTTEVQIQVNVGGLHMICTKTLFVRQPRVIFALQ